MKRQSAGILLYRRRGTGVEVLLVHPGGPFWAKKDVAVWSIPKGEFTVGEEPEAAARREFAEELGIAVPRGSLQKLDSVKYSGKEVFAWAQEGTLDPKHVKSNTFDMEWPPRSGQKQRFPEVDRAAWFTLSLAQTKLIKGQLPFLENLARLLNVPLPAAGLSTSSSPTSTAVSDRKQQTSLF